MSVTRSVIGSNCSRLALASHDREHQPCRRSCVTPRAACQRPDGTWSFPAGDGEFLGSFDEDASGSWRFIPFGERTGQ